ncbi:hypothetical protein PCG10_001176 [Penicillium crustosum]|uniref:DUF4246 domain-containing protein n=1 Tax=Penicillium crustosum TaxID=36656 RepID=A0A9P5GDB5_PENCR|nr:hypothetical protein PCG10_001176 [Penicillium crustosum]
MYKPKEEDPDDHQFYTLALQDEFRDQGPQAVVRIHSIELDPETPSFPGEEWHTEGNANERIVANAIYALDSENISEPQISFRQRCIGGDRTWVYDRVGADDSDNEERAADEIDDLILKYALWDVNPTQQTGWTRGDGAESATQMDLGEALELREELVKEHARKDEGVFVFVLASTLSFSGFS